MKSLSKKQMASLDGGQYWYNCPNICQSAYYNMRTSNPVLYFMALRIWSGKSCSNCYYENEG